MTAMLGISMGPVGWIAAGVIGLLGGLFGGFMGGAARRKQADNIVRQAVSQAKSLVDSYKNYQTDFGSTLGGISQISGDAQTQLGKLKGEGDKSLTRSLIPQMEKISEEVSAIEAERQRRAALSFSPPMFATGGYVGGSRIAGWRMGNGQVMAILHEGETVMNRRATAQNGPTLEAMNAGTSPGGSGVTIILQTWDPTSTRAWLRGPGGQEIADALKSRRKEGRS
jgi:hypothetical protein